MTTQSDLPELTPEDRKALDAMPMVVKWDAEFGVLVDQMGIMLTKADVMWLGHKCLAHMKEHSPLEREAIGRRTVERRGKSTALQFNFDLFKED